MIFPLFSLACVFDPRIFLIEFILQEFFVKSRIFIASIRILSHHFFVGFMVCASVDVCVVQVLKRCKAEAMHMLRLCCVELEAVKGRAELELVR